MDTSKPAPDADNHNTNQNEAACASRPVLISDQFQDPAFLNMANSQSQSMEVNVKTDTKLYGTLPTIIVTPPPGDSHGADDASEYNSFDQSVEQRPDDSSIRNESGILKDGTGKQDMNLLCAPSSDNTINISRPPITIVNVCRGMDTTNDESNDIEVICRYSSTPVMSSGRSGQSLDDTDCSMPSINNTSPIARADSTISTPNRSNSSRSVRDEGDGNGDDKESSTIEPQVQNIMYVHPQYLSQSSGQAMLRRDAPPNQSPQSTYDVARNINQGYTPATSLPLGGYPSTQNNYPGYMQGNGTYNDYYPARESSWTDLSYRSDISPVPPLSCPQADSCCYPMTGGVSSDAEYFVYPSIYVSSAGLISVLLRNDMSVEMTVDRTIRVVSHNHMMAVATDSRGTAACLYHPAVKVFQIGTTTDIATQNFRARMGGGDAIIFSNGVNFFKLEDSELQPTAPIKFTDILRDQSVNLLFSSEGYGESLVASCMQVAAQAEYANLPKGGVIVRINGVKVTQTGGGDVTVVTGAKFIRLSPHYGTTRLGNRFVDIEVEKDWTVKLTRGSHSFVYTKKRTMVCNGKMEAGFDENNGLKVINLQPRHPLLAEPSVMRRPTRKPVRVPSTSGTPKRRPGPGGPTNMGRGSGMG